MDLSDIPVHCRMQDIWVWRAAADRAGWALRYARLNVLALRKIVKKYDKVMRSHFGQDFLEVGMLAVLLSRWRWC